MEFSEIVKTRYACKQFTGEQVSEEQIDHLLELIRYSASSLGLQSYKILVISDQKLKEQLHKASFEQKQIISCSHLIVFCADTKIEEHVEAYFTEMEAQGLSKETIEDRKELIQGYLDKMTDTETWAKKQCYLGLGNAINGAQSLGLDSCPMEGFNPEAYKEILSLPENLHPTVLAAIGRAADKPRTKIRLPKEMLFEKR